MMKRTKLVLSGLIATLTFARWAAAGPPLICHALEIGKAPSLPWNEDRWSLSGRTDYDRSHLVADTLALLTPTAPVIVRMETIRRATLYANRDPQLAKSLLLALRTRALDAEKGGRPDALAWFDAGYLVECAKQANLGYRPLAGGGWEPVVHPNVASGLDGYAWVEKAISLRGQDPEMEFAAALIALGGSAEQRGHCLEHARRARAGEAADSLLAANLASHFIRDQGGTMAELLTRVETASKK